MSTTSGGQYTWQPDLPNACPPAAAQEADLTVYRLVKFDPPQPPDFARPVDNPHRNTTAELECSDYALSVYADPADVPLAKALIPGFKKRLVAAGRIERGQGLVLREPQPVSLGADTMLESHHDWWVPEGHDPMPSFVVVDL